MSRILMIDDDKALCRTLQIQLQMNEHELIAAYTAGDGLEAAAEKHFDLILLDLKLPDQNGVQVLQELAASLPDVPVVMITGQQDTMATIEAMRSGAFDYLRKPFELDDVLLLLEKIRRRNHITEIDEVTAASGDACCEVIGADRAMMEIVKQVGLLSRNRVSVLIEGESGTGKELVARALHEASSPGKPFMAINCSAVVGTLLESELFGYEKGAFTGADQRKIGKLEHAADGTVFLDEIGDMPLDLQSKLLRVLQERTFERVGGLESVPFRARVVAATNRDIDALVKQGEFRMDLYYRLAVSRIVVPPLRERRSDIRLLVNHLLARISQMLHRSIDGLEEEAVRQLQAYDWPGNVRELENVLTRAAALAKGSVLTADDLQLTFESPADSDREDDRQVVSLEDAEKKHILKALLSTGWNITHTARLLQISPTTLRKKIHDYQLRP